MAIQCFNRAAAHSTTNRTSTAYVTADINMVAGRVYMLGIRGQVASGTPGIGSVSDGTNTWNLVTTKNEANITIWVYSCVASSTGAFPVNITPDGVTAWTQAGWVVDEVLGASSTPVVQSASNSDPGTHTSLAVTLSSFDDATRNVAWGFFAHNEDTAITAGSGFSDLGASTENVENANRIKSIWKRGEDTSVDVTVGSTSADILGIAVEIAWAALPVPISCTPTGPTTAGTSHDVTVPAMAAGDSVLVIAATDGNPGLSIAESGWRNIADGGNNPQLSAWGFTAPFGGRAAGPVTIASTASEPLCAFVYHFLNGDVYDSTSEQNVYVATAVTQATAASRFPSTITPSWGTANYTYIAVQAHSSTQTMSSKPADLVHEATLNDGPGTASVSLSVGYKATVGTSTETFPDSDDDWVLSGSVSQVLVTIAVRSVVTLQTITLGAKIATAESFGTPTMRANISPSAVATAEVFGDHELQAGASNITPALIASAESFGDAELLQISVISLQGFGIASEEAFGLHELQPGAATISPDAIATAESFGTHNLQAAIRPGSIISAEAFGTPYFISHISPSGIATTEAFGTVILLRYIRPGAIGTGESFGTAELQPGTAYISPSAIATLESFGLHRLAKALAGRIPPPPGLAGDGAELQPGVSAFRVNPPSGQSKSGLWLPPGV
jgi:hypothetical protein